MERHHIPPSRSSPMPSMPCKGRDGSRMVLGHGKQGILWINMANFKKALQRSMMRSKRNKSEALDNLANAAISDRKTVEDLSKANKELSEANKQLTTQMEQINNKSTVIT
eukprot:2527789-Ditylum_brightwellii.AAC.1